MDNEKIKILLEKILILEKKVSENNKILKSIRSHNRWAMFLRFFYWVVLVGAAYGIWIFFQPVWETFKQGLNQVIDTKDNIKDSVLDIKEVFGSFLNK